MMKMEKMIMKLTSALEWNFAFEIELKRPLSLSVNLQFSEDEVELTRNIWD